MSYAAMVWALDHAGCAASAKLVLIALAERADGDGICWPSVSNVALRVGLSRRTVGNCFTELVERGVIGLEGRDGTSARIRLLGLGGPAQILRGSGDEEDSDPAKILRRGCENSAQGVRKFCAGGCADSAHEPIIEPTNEPTNEPAVAAPVPRPAKKRRAPQPAFDLGLPDFIPKRAWDDFVESRREKRNPLTTVAAYRLLRQLAAWHGRGLDIEAALDRSTVAGWSGVFEPKGRVSDAGVDDLSATLAQLHEQQRIEEMANGD